MTKTSKTEYKREVGFKVFTSKVLSHRPTSSYLEDTSHGFYSSYYFYIMSKKTGKHKNKAIL